MAEPTSELPLPKQMTEQEIRALMNRKPTTSDFYVIDEIGSGSYSDVQLCRDIKSRRLVAMKVVSAKTLKKERKENQAKRERDALIKCGPCPFVIDLFHTFFDQQMMTLNFVMPFIENGNLQMLLKYSGSCLNQKTTDHITFQLLQALEFMHKENLLHRDLKPENMLFTNKWLLKMCDFGTAIDTSVDLPGTFLGSAYYVSPEVITTKIATKASDYWAVGTILYEMLMGGKMFKGRGEYFIMQSITDSKFNALPMINNQKTIPYHDIILELTNKDQEIRTKAYKKLLNHYHSNNYQLNTGNFKIYAYTPFGEIENPRFEITSLKEILNVSDLLADRTDESDRHEDDIQHVNKSSYKKNVEPSRSAKYYGETVADYLSGDHIFKFIDENGGEKLESFGTIEENGGELNQSLIKILAHQHQHNKWSSFLPSDELILLQGDMFTRQGYERKVLETNKDPPAEAQMFILTWNPKNPKIKYLLGCIEDKEKFRIVIDPEKTRVVNFNNRMFAVLKNYPDRSWFFELSTDEDEIDEVNGQYISELLTEEDIKNGSISSDVWLKMMAI